MTLIPTAKPGTSSIEEALLFQDNSRCSNLLFPKGRTELNNLLCVGVLLPSLMVSFASVGVGRQLANESTGTELFHL